MATEGSLSQLISANLIPSVSSPVKEAISDLGEKSGFIQIGSINANPPIKEELLFLFGAPNAVETNSGFLQEWKGVCLEADPSINGSRLMPISGIALIRLINSQSLDPNNDIRKYVKYVHPTVIWRERPYRFPERMNNEVWYMLSVGDALNGLIAPDLFPSLDLAQEAKNSLNGKVSLVILDDDDDSEVSDIDKVKKFLS